MALREIIIDGDERLRKSCREIKEVNAHILTLLDDMAETMYWAEGVGLAAPQVGVLRRACVVDIGDGVLYELINPVIVEKEGEACGMEACLSVPDKSGYVLRPNRIVVEALNRQGEPVKIEAEGFLAVAMCHEIDHLDGILYTDKVIEPTEEQKAEAQRRNEEVARQQEGREQKAAKPLRGRRNTRVVLIDRQED